MTARMRSGANFFSRRTAERKSSEHLQSFRTSTTRPLIRSSKPSQAGAHNDVGAAILDVPQQLIDDILAWCDSFLKVCNDLRTLFIENRIFKQRNVDIGAVSLEECWRRGFSGVMVRGSGGAVGSAQGAAL